MAAIFEGLGLAHGAVAGGYVLSMALVCLVQYAFHMFRMSQAQQRNRRYEQQMQGLEGELNIAQKDRTISRLENQILREFVSETEVPKALEVVLRRFIPDTQTGFGAFVRFQEDGHGVHPVRGLSAESRKNLRIDRELLEEVGRKRTVVLEGRRLRESELLGSLSPADRGKAHQVYLLAVGDTGEAAGTLITTNLYPAGAALEQQLELGQRLMQSISGNLKRAEVLERQEHRLRATSEMLDLRSLADGQFDSPLKMLDAFVNRLREMVGAERGALYLATQDELSDNAIVRCGAAMHSGMKQRWQAHEDKLAHTCLGLREPLNLSRDKLRNLQIDTLVGSALVSPLVQNGAIGVLCLTRAGHGEFTEDKIRLMSWASEYLADTIRRVLSHAVVARQARHDALTDLANRRSFDKALGDELELSTRSGGACSLLLLDLDRFKSVNDTYGHQAGDAVLRATAAILKDQVFSLRSGDRALVARYGGEEIAVLLPGISETGARRIGEAMRSAIEAATVPVNQGEIRVTVSVGLATFPAHGRDAAGLIAAADSALYQAKESGRNRLCVATGKALVGAR